MMARRTVLQAGGWAAGLALLGVPLVSADSPVVDIRMRGNADGSAVWFDPVGVLIAPGQTVRWINTDRGNSHTSTAYHPNNTGHPWRIPEAAEPWNSNYLLPDEEFELRFTAVGVYDYFCIPHEEAGMVGRIVVGSPTSADPPSDNLPEAARQMLPEVEEIIRHRVVRTALRDPVRGRRHPPDARSLSDMSGSAERLRVQAVRTIFEARLNLGSGEHPIPLANSALAFCSCVRKQREPAFTPPDAHQPDDFGRGWTWPANSPTVSASEQKMQFSKAIAKLSDSATACLSSVWLDFPCCKNQPQKSELLQ